MLLLVAAALTRLAALAQLGLLPLRVDRGDGAARATMAMTTEESTRDTARSFFISFGLVESPRESMETAYVSRAICINKSGILHTKKNLKSWNAQRLAQAPLHK